MNPAVSIFRVQKSNNILSYSNISVDETFSDPEGWGQLCQSYRVLASVVVSFVLDFIRMIQRVPLATEPGISGWLADHCSVSQQLGALQTHYSHIPFHFSHNERTPVQISLQYLH